MRKFLRAAAFILGIALLAEIANLSWLYHARATVTTQTSSIVGLGDGSNTVFTFPFVGVASSDITVTYTDTSGTEAVLTSTQYTLALNAPATGAIWGVGGTVTYPLSGSPIAAGTTLTIERTLPYTQTVSSNQGQAFPRAIETGLDLLDMQIQQVYGLIGRAISVSVTDTCSALGNLPTASSRANQMLGFDSTGCNPIVAQPASALVSSAMQPVVDAATIAAARALLGIDTNFNVPVGAELDWPGLSAPAYWKLEDGSAISRTTYSALLAVIAPVVACTITSGSSTITGISSTVGWGTGWTIESPGSSALGTGRSVATVGGSSVTISGGNATANATSCQIFPYGTAQDGTFKVPNAAGVVYAGLDTASVNLDSTYCTGNPAYMNASCGNKSATLITGNLPAYTPTGTVGITDPGHTHTYDKSVAGGTSYSGGGNVPNNGFTSTASGTSQTGITAAFAGTAQGGASTPFSQLQPTRIRNKIVFTGAP